jgi:hypothetical protein
MKVVRPVIADCFTNAGNILSNWHTSSSKHRLVIYPDGIARETMNFIAGLLGDQQVDLLHLVYLLML